MHLVFCCEGERYKSKSIWAVLSLFVAEPFIFQLIQLLPREIHLIGKWPGHWTFVYENNFTRFDKNEKLFWKQAIEHFYQNQFLSSVLGHQKVWTGRMEWFAQI